MLTTRYFIYDGLIAIATVHATSGEEAIRLACEKVDGHEPADCRAVAVVTGSRSGIRTTTGSRTDGEA